MYELSEVISPDYKKVSKTFSIEFYLTLSKYEAWLIDYNDMKKPYENGLRVPIVHDFR